ncbi:MAG: hypothetical protein LW698_15510 [Planctomycetaceae bacterium]|nr:hypothetical protein [Planctomycetaceae bacterium]
MVSHTFALVQLASGDTLTTPNLWSQPTIGAVARSGLWSRRIAVIQASKRASTRFTTASFRSLQQRSGSLRYSGPPWSRS